MPQNGRGWDVEVGDCIKLVFSQSALPIMCVYHSRLILMHSGFLKEIFLQQTKNSGDSLKTLTADTVSFLSQSCKSVHHFYDIALSEYNQQKNVFFQTLLQMNKIDRDSPVSKTSIQSIVCFLHPTWTAGQVREKN